MSGDLRECLEGKMLVISWLLLLHHMIAPPCMATPLHCLNVISVLIHSAGQGKLNWILTGYCICPETIDLTDQIQF